VVRQINRFKFACINTMEDEIDSDKVKAASIKTIVITSREPYNQEGNSHMHYTNELAKRFNVVFVNPPLKFPTLKFEQNRIHNRLTIVPYLNVFPMRFLPVLFGKLNDMITALFLSKMVQEKKVILWQFDPYYLSFLAWFKPYKKLYFPLDRYSFDRRDLQVAKNADLLVTVNSTFIERLYHKLIVPKFLVPHGFSMNQKSPSVEVVDKMKNKYGNFAILTGALSSGVDYQLLHKVADHIQPNKLVIIGKKLVDFKNLELLFKKDNVVYLGVKPFDELKNFIAASMCCLVAYDKATDTWRNPIKITDYLIQEKAVINTIPLKDLEIYQQIGLYTSRDANQYLEWVKQGIKGGLKVDNTKIQRLVGENSYQKLVARILKELESIA